MSARTLRMLALAAVPALLAAQQPPQAQPPQQPPRDTTPAEAYYGVTEYQQARAKLAALMQPTGFTVYIIADMEGLAGVVRNATEMRPEARGGHDPTHEAFRKELADEVNAVFQSSRRAVLKLGL